MVKPILLQGKRFGKWKVLNESPIRNKRQGHRWKCKCDCGTERIVRSSDLRKGISTSCGCSFRRPKGESACWWLYRNYIKQARGLPFELTFEDFKILTKKDCYYCGVEPKNVVDRTNNRSNGIYTYNGIDRINNNRGYLIENVVPCCKVCNSMKGKLSQEDFFKHMKKIIKKRK